jgi:glutathione S-transferase
MTIGSDELVVHHHDAGYYSQKVRSFLGIKGVRWHSVNEPLISPKPEFVRLTGGYQRVPMLQVGSDLFCDSKLALLELERRAPGPAASGPLDFVVNAWVDKVMTPATFAVGLPDMTPAMPPIFIQDRAELYGPSFDLEAIKGASVLMSAQWRAQVAWLEDALQRSGGEFLTGDAPTIADVAAFTPIWFVNVRLQVAESLRTPTDPADTKPVPEARAATDHVEALLDGFERVKDWRDRMIALGEGDRRAATYEDAFALAAATEPAPAPAHDRSDPLGLTPGTAVTVIADDSVRDPVTGTLVAATPERIVVAREEEGLGRLHVHFPRFSYFVQAAA